MIADQHQQNTDQAAAMQTQIPQHIALSPVPRRPRMEGSNASAAFHDNGPFALRPVRLSEVHAPDAAADAGAETGQPIAPIRAHQIGETAVAGGTVAAANFQRRKGRKLENYTLPALQIPGEKAGSKPVSRDERLEYLRDLRHARQNGSSRAAQNRVPAGIEPSVGNSPVHDAGSAEVRDTEAEQNSAGEPAVAEPIQVPPVLPSGQVAESAPGDAEPAASQRQQIQESIGHVAGGVMLAASITRTRRPPEAENNPPPSEQEAAGWDQLYMDRVASLSPDEQVHEMVNARNRYALAVAAMRNGGLDLLDAGNAAENLLHRRHNLRATKSYAAMEVSREQYLIAQEVYYEGARNTSRAEGHDDHAINEAILEKRMSNMDHLYTEIDQYRNAGAWTDQNGQFQLPDRKDIIVDAVHRARSWVAAQWVHNDRFRNVFEQVLPAAVGMAVGFVSGRTGLASGAVAPLAGGYVGGKLNALMEDNASRYRYAVTPAGTGVKRAAELERQESRTAFQDDSIDNPNLLPEELDNTVTVHERTGRTVRENAAQIERAKRIGRNVGALMGTVGGLAGVASHMYEPAVSVPVHHQSADLTYQPHNVPPVHSGGVMQAGAAGEQVSIAAQHNGPPIDPHAVPAVNGAELNPAHPMQAVDDSVRHLNDSLPDKPYSLGKFPDGSERVMYRGHELSPEEQAYFDEHMVA